MKWKLYSMHDLPLTDEARITATISPSYPAPTMASTTTQTLTSTQPPPARPQAQPAPPPVTRQQIDDAFNRAFRRAIREGGGGGGSGGAQPPIPPQALQPVPCAPDVRAMGKLPADFHGDQAKGEDFLGECKGYLLLNEDVPGFDSPKKKIQFVLTHMKGPDVAGWVKDMQTLLTTIDPANNVPILWDQFLVEFERNFQDTAKADKARTAIQNVQMKGDDVDAYIAGFEQLARRAGYTTGSPETERLFLQGLPREILQDVKRAPPVYDYEDIKERAIQSAAAQRVINSIQRGKGSAPPARYTPFFQRSHQQRPQYTPNRFQPRPAQSYHSSNAPRWMNDKAVPMDLSRTRAPVWRAPQTGQNQGRGPPRHYSDQRPQPGTNRANAATTNPTRGNFTCFSCGKPGHYAKDCRSKAQQRINLVDFDPEYEVEYQGNQVPLNRVASATNTIAAMSFDEKKALITQMGREEEEQQDFQTV